MFKCQEARDGGSGSESWISNLRLGPQAKPRQQPTIPAELAKATPAVPLEICF